MVARTWRETCCDVKSLFLLPRSEEVSSSTDTGRTGSVMNAVGAVQLIALLLGSKSWQLEHDFHVGRIQRLEALLGAA